MSLPNKERAKKASSKIKNNDSHILVQELLEWSASLSSQLEMQQVENLKKKLLELSAADIDDELRLQLMNIVTTALDRLVTMMHSHYLYELGALSVEQLVYARKVKSLYYHGLVVYDKIIKRQIAHLDAQHSVSSISKWQLWLKPKQPPSLLLASAIYQTLLYYQKLIYEKAICYQSSLTHLWSALNQLYYLASQQDMVHVDLSTHVATPYAMSIHELYIQLSLFSVLNIRAMHRPNIVLMQRLLPTWMPYTSATIEPQTETRLFVDLHSHNPPEYLNAHSRINPYDEHHDCLFIELTPLVSYLSHQKQYMGRQQTESIEYHLLNQALTIINYRYIERLQHLPSKRGAAINADLIARFDAIHYHVAGNKSIKTLLADTSLPFDQLPRYDTEPKSSTDIEAIAVKTYDNSDLESPFRVLQLSSKPNNVKSAADNHEKLAMRGFKTSQKVQGQLLESLIAALLEVFNEVRESTATPTIGTMPILQLENLLLLSRPSIDDTVQWSLGIVRWLDLDADDVEVEWQLLGHKIAACALRLNNINATNISYVPAFIILGEETLQIKSSLLVPSYHFRSMDKVILRLNGQESTLNLQRCVRSTKTFSQYEFMLVLN